MTSHAVTVTTGLGLICVPSTLLVQTDGHRVLVQPRTAGTVSGRTTSGRTASGRTISGRPTSAGQHHGYKGSLLFRPLPDPDTAVKSG
jgi:hypothetical protein